MRAPLEALAERVTEHVVELNEGLSERGEGAITVLYCAFTVCRHSMLNHHDIPLVFSLMFLSLGESFIDLSQTALLFVCVAYCLVGSFRGPRRDYELV